MRVKTYVLVSAIALLALSCAPHRPCVSAAGEPCHGKRFAAAMGHACQPDGCAYESRCYSNGAIRANGGACQECSAGKWVSATGCAEYGCPMMGKGGCPMMGKGPCPMMGKSSKKPCPMHPGRHRRARDH